MRQYALCLIIMLFMLGCAANQKNADTNEPLTEEEIIAEQQRQEMLAMQKSWWVPSPGIGWHYQLNTFLQTYDDAHVYDIDLFDTPQETIDELHTEGKRVICYFSAGTYESNREDMRNISQELLGESLEDFPDERWIDIRDGSLQQLMLTRLDLAKEKRCDGVEADNVDAFENINGLDIRYDDQLYYNRLLANEAHKRNLSIGLKNDLEQIEELVDFFDFAINEQCFEFEECDFLEPFTEQSKAVFGVEYGLEPEEFCDEANEKNLSWLVMDVELDGNRYSCKEHIAME